jgi:hypothetical protein
MYANCPVVNIESVEFKAGLTKELTRLENAGLIKIDYTFGDIYGYIFTESGLFTVDALGLDFCLTPARYAAYVIYGY